MAKQPPAPEPVSNDETPERIIADPATQEAGHSDWQGRLLAQIADDVKALAEERAPELREFTDRAA